MLKLPLEFARSQRRQHALQARHHLLGGGPVAGLPLQAVVRQCAVGWGAGGREGGEGGAVARAGGGGHARGAAVPELPQQHAQREDCLRVGGEEGGGKERGREWVQAEERAGRRRATRARKVVPCATWGCGRVLSAEAHGLLPCPRMRMRVAAQQPCAPSPHIHKARVSHSLSAGGPTCAWAWTRGPHRRRREVRHQAASG